jgi:penicillin amidase
MRTDLPQPLVFNTWMRRFETAILSQTGIGDTTVGPGIDIIGQALSPDGAALCGGDCTALLETTLAEATAELGPEPDKQRWGEAHQAVFAHPLLGRMPVIGPLATWRIPQPGDDSTIFRGIPRKPGWDSVHGPAFRGVYDLANLDASLFGLAPGQSGNPLLATASSLMRRWRDGVPVRLGPRPDRVADTIGLEP